MADKYLPPAKRNGSNIDLPKNRRRNFSEESNFNTRTLSYFDEPPIKIKKIIIPEIIEPPIVSKPSSIITNYGKMDEMEKNISKIDIS